MNLFRILFILFALPHIVVAWNVKFQTYNESKRRKKNSNSIKRENELELIRVFASSSFFCLKKSIIFFQFVFCYTAVWRDSKFPQFTHLFTFNFLTQWLCMCCIITPTTTTAYYIVQLFELNFFLNLNIFNNLCSIYIRCTLMLTS